MYCSLPAASNNILLTGNWYNLQKAIKYVEKTPLNKLSPSPPPVPPLLLAGDLPRHPEDHGLAGVPDHLYVCMSDHGLWPGSRPPAAPLRTPSHRGLRLGLRTWRSPSTSGALSSWRQVVKVRAKWDRAQKQPLAAPGSAKYQRNQLTALRSRAVR